jgi:acyl-CoA synthetase (AMP-forming)/AMP-acid ligase II
MRVEQLLSDSAVRFGEKAAIVAERRRHSYSELDAKSDRLAAALTSRGVKAGDRFAVFMDDSFAAIVTAFAVLKAGAVVSPVDPSIDAAGLAPLLHRLHAVGIATEARLASTAAEALADAPGVKLVVLAGGDRAASHGTCISYEDIVGRAGAIDKRRASGSSEDAAVVLQAGLGKPGEALVLTHGDLVAAAAAADTPRDEVVLAAVPISSHYGLYQLLTGIRVGATQILESASAARRNLLIGADAFCANMSIALAG